jgi:NAD(P)-dependent dehydrogenase (short-subunit alcohol dehydrogenase family)
MNAASPGAALVTGAARRIGRAIAAGLGHAGWAVAVHCHNSRADAQSLVDEIAAKGGRAAVVAADLADAADTAGLVARAAKALGPLSLLVNNASIFERDTAATMTPESFDRHMAVNARAPFLLAQAFARQVPDGRQANIVNLIDSRVWRPKSDYTSYAVSKSALWSLTQMLAIEMAPGIRVNAIGPGPVLPNARQSAAHFARQWAATPLGRGATPEEIAEAVLYLVRAPGMTGQMLALDGGEHLL